MGIWETGAIAFNRIARIIRLTTSSRNTAEVIICRILDSTFSSLSVGAITATDDELKTIPRSNEPETFIPDKNPREKPVTRGTQKLNTVK